MQKSRGYFFWGWILKLNFFILAFGLTVYAIYYMQNHGAPTSILAVLGLDTPAVERTQKLFWCETRVAAVAFPDGEELKQHGRKWIRQKGLQQSEVNAVAIEKWFGKNCGVMAEKVVSTSPDTVGGAQFAPVLRVQFVTGGSAELLRSADGRYLWGSLAFISPNMDKALSDLVQLVRGSGQSSVD